MAVLILDAYTRLNPDFGDTSVKLKFIIIFISK